MVVHNEGEHPVRVILDKDTIDDSQSDAGATVESGALGGIVGV